MWEGHRHRPILADVPISLKFRYDIGRYRAPIRYRPISPDVADIGRYDIGDPKTHIGPTLVGT